MFLVIIYLQQKVKKSLWSAAKEFNANKLQNIWIPENSGQMIYLVLSSWKGLDFSHYLRDKMIQSAFI